MLLIHSLMQRVRYQIYPNSVYSMLYLMLLLPMELMRCWFWSHLSCYHFHWYFPMKMEYLLQWRWWQYQHRWYYPIEMQMMQSRSCYSLHWKSHLSSHSMMQYYYPMYWWYQIAIDWFWISALSNHLFLKTNFSQNQSQTHCLLYHSLYPSFDSMQIHHWNCHQLCWYCHSLRSHPFD